MVRWYCYPTSDEPDLWAHWLAQQSKRVQAKHAAVMRFLAAGHWQRPHYRKLVGAHRGLGEIRISADVEWRLIGRRDENGESFTVLLICNHKNQNYTPRDALDTALRRWREIKNGCQQRRERNEPPA